MHVSIESHRSFVVHQSGTLSSCGDRVDRGAENWRHAEESCNAIEDQVLSVSCPDSWISQSVPEDQDKQRHRAGSIGASACCSCRGVIRWACEYVALAWEGGCALMTRQWPLQSGRKFPGE